MGQFQKNVFLFTFGNVFINAASFFLLPLYTHLISPSDYGVINFLLIVSSFLTVVVSLSIHGGLSRFYFDCKNNNEIVELYTSIVMFSFTTSALVYGGIAAVVFWIKNDTLFSIKKTFFYVVLSISWLNILINNANSLLVSMQDAKKVTFVTMLISMTGIILNIIFITNFQDKIAAFFWGNFITRVLHASIYMCFTKKFLCLSLWRKTISQKLSKVLKYSVIRMPLELSAFATTFADRVMLYNLKASYDVGLYSIGYKIGSISDIIMMSVNTAMVPYLFGKLSKDTLDYSEVEKTSLKVFAFFSFIVFGFSLIINDIFLFLDKRYASANIVTLLILYSFYFNGMKLIFQVPLDYNIKFAKYKSLLWCFITGLNIFCNFIFIPLFGGYGAAFATLLSYILILPFIVFLAYKASPVRIRKEVIVIALITFTGGVFIFIKVTLVFFILKCIACICIAILFLSVLHINITNILTYFKNRFFWEKL